MENRVIIHSYQDNTNIKCSHCLLRNGIVYMITESHEVGGNMLYNLTNLSTGRPYTDPRTMTNLAKIIEQVGFKYLGNIELGVHEKLPLEGEE